MQLRNKITGRIFNVVRREDGGGYWIRGGTHTGEYFVPTKAQDQFEETFMTPIQLKHKTQGYTLDIIRYRDNGGYWVKDSGGAEFPIEHSELWQFEVIYKDAEISGFMPEDLSKPISIITKALQVYQDRDDQYGSPKPMFEVIANVWGSLIKHPLTAEQAALMMVVFKVVREYHGTKPKEDNLIDIIGYAECASQCI